MSNSEALRKLSNRPKPSIIVGDSALAYNHLAYGTPGYSIYIEHEPMERYALDEIVFEYYHFHDNYQLREIRPNVFLPSPERAIIDTIVWLPENMNEGALIEALQNYQQKNGKEKLYECADHYKVPHEFVDVWWKEAEEESDMSMG